MTALTLVAPRQVTRTHGRSFYLASHLLPRELGQACFLLYAFLRRYDDAVDDGGPAIARAAIEEGEAFVRWARGGERPSFRVLPDAEAHAFCDLVRRVEMPTEPLADFFLGLRDDVWFTPPATDADLDRYCYRVAGTVGLMMAWLLGVRDAAALERAAMLGWAMQLTNVLRDVDEDRARGRVYLPDGSRAAMAAHAARARRLYEAALVGVDAIPTFRARACVGVMARVYAGILDELEACAYRPTGRAAVSPARRLWLATEGVLATSVWREPC